jgi:hypothetical protein
LAIKELYFCLIKTTPAKDLDEYTAGFPRETQTILEQIRATIKKVELWEYAMSEEKITLVTEE